MPSSDIVSLKERGPGARSIHIDVVRGVAVFGILLVNIWSFAWGFGYLRYGVLSESASFADRSAIFIVSFLAEQKFYPIFGFLFGAGFALQSRALRKLLPDWNRVRARYRGRLRWLLGWGILHGLLIWAGDILTIYGLTGFLILGLAGAKLKRVCANLWNWFMAWLVLVAVNFVTSIPMLDNLDASGEGKNLIRNAQQTYYFYTQGTVFDQMLQRLGDYVTVTTASILMVPHLIVLFLLGIMSVRLGWLAAPWRHSILWRRVRAAGYGIGIPFNLVWAGVALSEATTPLDPAPHGLMIYALLPVGGSLLAAAYVASIMLASPKTMHGLASWLAPVGRMALTNYLTQSILGVALLQGVGLGLGRYAAGSPWLLILIAISVMLFQVMVSRWWMSQHSRGPIESLYRLGRGRARNCPE